MKKEILPEKITTGDPHLKWIEQITFYMDSAVRIPGTKFRFGADPILGFFPYIGELISFFISSLLVLSMVRFGVSGKVVLLMLLNVALDAVIGSIPLLGDIFDFAYKANDRNLRLLREFREKGKHKGSGIDVVIYVLLGLLFILFLMLWLMWKIISWMLNLF